MLVRLYHIARVLVVALGVGLNGVRAADAAPVVGPGATKEEAITAYGWPSGQSQAGTKEILTYPQGRITLENGRVEKVDFSTTMPWPAPRPRPGPAGSVAPKKAEAPADFWLTGFEEAQKEAARRNARILAAFIGSDWSPPSRQFWDEVALHPDFVNTFTGDFVFLRLDFPTRTAQSAELKEQNSQLRGKYGVTTYPSLLVLSPAGTVVGTIDLTKSQTGDSYRARTVAAVREVRDLLRANPPAPDPVVAPAEPPEPVVDARLSTPLALAKSVVGQAIAGGLLFVIVAWWWLWRKRGPDADAPVTSMATRIANAASGLPNAVEIAEWPKEKLRGIVAALAEADGYAVRVRAGGGDGDLALTREGSDLPNVIVSCQPGAAGPVSAKRLRELFGTITLESIGTGWFVSPAGFSKEARDYAREHVQILLIDAQHLRAQLDAVPPISVGEILAREK